MSGPKYPSIRMMVSRSSPQGNAFYLLGKVKHALLEHEASESEVAEFLDEATNNDYDHLLEVIGEWIDFVHVE